MKKAPKTFEELIQTAPKLEMHVGQSFPNAFKEKMERNEKILSTVGLPNRPKK
jgi:hypothetical protein